MKSFSNFRIRSVLSAITMFALTSLAYGDSTELRNLAQSLSDSAYRVRNLTDDFIDGDVSADTVRLELDRLRQISDNLRNKLGSGGSGNISSCIQTLRQQGYSQGDSSSYCQQAGSNANLLGECVSSMRQQGYNYADSANFCVSAGSSANSFPGCVSSLRQQGYNYSDSASYCKSAGPYGAAVAQCISSLRQQGYSYSDSASNCVQARSNASTYPGCVSNLRQQGYSYSEAARICHSN